MALPYRAGRVSRKPRRFPPPTEFYFSSRPEPLARFARLAGQDRVLFRPERADETKGGQDETIFPWARRQPETAFGY
jgi:hypothetical protein